jgi:hypothetical protein
MTMIELSAAEELANQGMAELVCSRSPAQPAAAVKTLLASIDRVFIPSALRECLHAGLWVAADELDRAHEICQQVPNSFGSAWHAVVHRREGDFWNSKYWWRRAGGVAWNSVAARLGTTEARGGAGGLSRAMEATFPGGQYDPARFVDLVEGWHSRRDEAMKSALALVQRAEWMALFEGCWKSAGGP